MPLASRNVIAGVRRAIAQKRFFLDVLKSLRFKDLDSKVPVAQKKMFSAHKCDSRPIQPSITVSPGTFARCQIAVR